MSTRVAPALLLAALPLLIACGEEEDPLAEVLLNRRYYTLEVTRWFVDDGNVVVAYAVTNHGLEQLDRLTVDVLLADPEENELPRVRETIDVSGLNYQNTRRGTFRFPLDGREIGYLDLTVEESPPVEQFDEYPEIAAVAGE